MSIQKLLLLFVLLAGIISFPSCGDDEDDAPDGCVICKLEIPLLSDCEVTICDDASNDVNGDAIACVPAVGIVGDDGTREERVAQLEAAGFSCN